MTSTMDKLLDNSVNSIMRAQWTLSRPRGYPNLESVLLSGGAVEVDATYLYADLANSSKMAMQFDRRITAKILKSFLECSARLIKFRHGKILSYDGDRVLGIFMGLGKETRAAWCALNIHHVVHNVIKPKFRNYSSVVRNANFSIAHGVGIDTGITLMVRGGIKGTNDFISIGEAPNLAAKLSDIRYGTYPTIITKRVYDKLDNSVVYSALRPSENMWQSKNYVAGDKGVPIYVSDWWARP